MRLTSRLGATVAELAIALVIAGCAAAIGAGLLIAAERRARRDGSDGQAAQTAREVLHALRGDIESARWDAVVLRGDTAIDVQSHVGVSVICSSNGTAVVLPPATTSRPEPFSAWRYPPEASDIAAMWDSSGAWRYTTIDSVVNTISGCRADGAFRTVADSLAARTMIRLVTSASVTPPPFLGAPIRIYRQVRWMIYRGGDRRWWLGQRRCPANTCGTAQPVAGPLAAPSDSGLRFAIWPDGRVLVAVRAEPGERRPPVVRGEFTLRGVPRVAP